MASFVILVWCHIVSPYNWAVQQIAFCGEAVISGKSLGQTRIEFLQVRLEQKEALSITISKPGALLRLGALLDRQFQYSPFSFVVTVGARPVGLRFKIIPYSRNVLILQVMKFWDNV